jgi:hypothetical protein
VRTFRDGSNHVTELLKVWKEAYRAIVRYLIHFGSGKSPNADLRIEPQLGCFNNQVRVSSENGAIPRRRSAPNGRAFKTSASADGTRGGFGSPHDGLGFQTHSDIDQLNRGSVTEEEVKALGYRPVLFADGRGVFAQVWASTTPRVWQYIHSKRGSKLFVDGVLVRDRTPAAIAKLLNTQEPKELTATDIFQLGNEKG